MGILVRLRGGVEVHGLDLETATYARLAFIIGVSIRMIKEYLTILQAANRYENHRESTFFRSYSADSRGGDG